MKNSNALANLTWHLIGLCHKFATVYPRIYCRKLNVINVNVTLYWLISGFTQLTATAIGATNYIFTVFLKEMSLVHLDGNNHIQNFHLQSISLELWLEITFYGSADVLP